MSKSYANISATMMFCPEVRLNVEAATEKLENIAGTEVHLVPQDGRLALTVDAPLGDCANQDEEIVQILRRLGDISIDGSVLHYLPEDDIEVVGPGEEAKKAKAAQHYLHAAASALEKAAEYNATVGCMADVVRQACTETAADGLPPLVVEFHYDDGDVGVYPADGFLEKALWSHFSGSPEHCPSHILIREDSDAGQAVSSRLMAAPKAICAHAIRDALTDLVEAFSETGEFNTYTAEKSLADLLSAGRRALDIETNAPTNGATTVQLSDLALMADMLDDGTVPIAILRTRGHRVIADLVEAQRMEFAVHPDPDQTGLFYFQVPNGERSAISFESESAAWKQVLAELPTYREKVQ